MIKKRFMAPIAAAVAATVLSLGSGNAVSAIVCDTNAAPIAVPQTTAGIYINFLTNASGTAAGTTGWDFNPWGSTNLNFGFAAGSSGLVTGGKYAALAAGVSVDATGTYATSTTAAQMADWRAGVTAKYVGLRYVNESTTATNYGWAELSTTGPSTGTPATVNHWCTQNDGTGILTGATGAVVTHIVTPSVGTASGTITPNTPQTVNNGATTGFTLSANAGFHINNVGGTCGGLLTGSSYTTAAVTTDCTVIANFAADAVPPTASVTPSPFTLSVAAGASTSGPLTIANTGGGSLTWSLTEAAAARPLVAPTAAQLATQGARNGERSGGTSLANPAPQAVVINEGFDDITTLAGAGWLQVNNSSPAGLNAWFQGNPTNFNAFDGATTAYISANFNSGGDPPPTTISNWLVTPLITFNAGSTASFYTRSISGAFPDRMQVRLCTGAACTNVGTGPTGTGDFGTVLLDINPTYTAAGYPTAWTQQTLSGLPSTGTGRIAFRYFVEDAGPSGAHSNLIGIDRVVIDNGSVVPPTGCTNPSDVPWLSESVTSGSVAGGGSQATSVTVNAAALTAGSYSAHICVATNDTAHALVDVPVNVTVTTGTPTNHTVTSSVGTPSGTITPLGAVTVADGASTNFTLAANAGFHINNVTGSCVGTLAGAVFTVTAVTADCSVIANFAADGPPGNLVMTVGVTPGGDGTTCGTQTSAIVNVGDQVDFCYTVTNNSTVAMTLSTLDDSVDGNIFANMPTPIAANGGTYVYHRNVPAVTSSTYNETWTARDILPGYTSNDTAPVGFVDIAATGTALNTTDDGNAVVTSPFPFSFYGAPSTQFCVGNNGVLVAGPTCAVAFGNTALPGIFGGAAMAVFWDDFFNVTGNVYWQVQGVSPNRKLIIEWDRAHYELGDESPTRATVEAILGEDNSLSFQYNSTAFGTAEDHGTSATIGLQNADSSLVNQYSFNTALPHPDPSAIAWTSGTATVLTATASVSLDVGAPVIGVTPTSISASAPPGSSTPVTANLSIANTGDRDLTFTIDEAPGDASQVPQPTSVSLGGDRVVVLTGKDRQDLYAQRKEDTLSGHPVQASMGHKNSPIMFPHSNVLPAGTTDCGATVEGIIIHDDGTAENGYSGNATTVSSFVGVDKFTPSSYPATFTSACVSFITNAGTTSTNYEVVVYDDTGAGGGPGTELGAVSAIGVVTGISPLTFNSVDISALGLNITSGSVYIGVRLNPQTATATYLASDESGSTSGNGYASFDTGSGPEFTPIGDSFPGYVSLMVRAVEGTSGCVSPADVPWLSVAPNSGTVVVGAPPATSVATLNPTGLVDGLYTATICVNSNDPAHHVTAVPVEFIVGDVLGTATVAPSSLAFAIEESGPATQQTLTVSNTGDVGSHINFTVTESAGSCATPSDVAWLSETPTSGDATVTTPVPVVVNADATGLAAGTYNASICIASNDAATPVITVPVTLTVTAADLIFADGFEGVATCDAASQLLLDPSFEASLDGSGPWDSTSTNFGTALCDDASCGSGNGTATARTGTVWAWFGGTADPETATASQAVVIPAGTRFLNFYLWIGSATGGAGATNMDVNVDGTSVVSYPEPAVAEAGYTLRSIDMSAFADGASHTIEFNYVATGTSSNYSVDDVTLDCAAGSPVAPRPAPNAPKGPASFRLAR